MAVPLSALRCRLPLRVFSSFQFILFSFIFSIVRITRFTLLHVNHLHNKSEHQFFSTKSFTQDSQVTTSIWYNESHRNHKKNNIRITTTEHKIRATPYLTTPPIGPCLVVPLTLPYPGCLGGQRRPPVSGGRHRPFSKPSHQTGEPLCKEVNASLPWRVVASSLLARLAPPLCKESDASSLRGEGYELDKLKTSRLGLSLFSQNIN
jgi:hypothetical protein